MPSRSMRLTPHSPAVCLWANELDFDFTPRRTVMNWPPITKDKSRSPVAPNLPDFGSISQTVPETVSR